MTGRAGVAARGLGLLVLAWLLASCAGQGRARDPFSSPGPGGDRGPAHWVRFEVSCDTCQIRWEVGGRSGLLTTGALWSHRVGVPIRAGATARLSAGPAGGAERIKWVRIFVDGKVAAEASTDMTEAAGASRGMDPGLTVATAVPPDPPT